MAGVGRKPDLIQTGWVQSNPWDTNKNPGKVPAMWVLGAMWKSPNIR
jgi:hypothetical protein